ncbi:MAG: recombinase family protein [Gemmatimonadota bacterium]|nr:recombinase family protein [Gemmatimonadota bacterium]
MNSKIQAHHRQKMACVYLRQSTMAQVYHHQESTNRQYALKDRALELGWPPDQIRVLDADLGQSGTQMNNRQDFKTLVAEVSLEKVGAVFALEASRLSRSCSDWHRLLEICSLTGTLIVDADGCYDPADFNDQLLLGLKGTMSQAELHFIRARLQGGKRNKAHRGELRFPLPVGYVYGDEPGSVLFDPDTEVHNAVRLVFTLFRQTGSAYGVVRHFLQHNLSFPRRAYGGVWNGKIIWGKLQHGRVLGLLSNPSYAGAYVFGRYRGAKSISPEGQIRSRVQRLPIDSWLVLIQEHHPGYINWDDYLENQQMLEQNQTNQLEQCSSGAAREGRALLQGLLLCGHCGRGLSPRYTGNGGIYPVYECTRRQTDTRYSAECVRIQADLMDKTVSDRVLEILRPEQVEIALRAVKELERRSQAVDQQWRMRIERLEYQSQLAQRRYEEVDPSNRLVAGTLERRWNDALEELKTAQGELHQSRQQQGLELTEQQKTQLRALAEDLPKLWKSQTTSAQDRKRMLRLLLKDITVEKRRVERKAVLHIRWQGGALEDLSVDLPLPAPDKVRYPETLVSRVRSLAAAMTDAQITATLNQEGLLSAKGKPFTPSKVKWIRGRHDIPAPSLKNPDELTVGEVAGRFAVRPGVVYYWIERGHLPARRLGHGTPYWINLGAEKEAELRAWVTNSNRIKQTQTQNPAASGAI